jgi:hypothetical protein
MLNFYDFITYSITNTWVFDELTWLWRMCGVSCSWSPIVLMGIRWVAPTKLGWTVLLSSRIPDAGNAAGGVTSCRPSDLQGNVDVVFSPHCTDPLAVAMVYALTLPGQWTKVATVCSPVVLELCSWIGQNRPGRYSWFVQNIPRDLHVARFPCPDPISITCLFYYSKINSSPPRATPPWIHDPGRPARHPHHDMHA